jgi:hypothetical protein
MKKLGYFPLTLPGYMTVGRRTVSIIQGTDSLIISIHVPGRADDDLPEVLVQWTEQGTDIVVTNGCEEIASHHIVD